MTNMEFVKKCIVEKTLRKPALEDAIKALRFEFLTKEDARFLKENYFSLKGDILISAYKFQILIALVLQCLKHDMKEFFLEVFKRERDIFARLVAIRGYSASAMEKEVNEVMGSFIKTLKKGTYDAEMMDALKSVFGLPYLVKKYGYECFKQAIAIVNSQYEMRPDELKGYYTLDEYGRMVELVPPEEVSKRMDAFFKREGIE